MKNKKCYICGNELFNERGMYCNDCLKEKRKDSVFLSRKRKMLSNETNEEKIKFYIEAIKQAEKSLISRRAAYIKELKHLGYDYKEEQMRLT